MPTQKERKGMQKVLKSCQRKFTSQEVDELIQKNINLVAENYQRILAQVKTEASQLKTNSDKLPALEKRLTEVIAHRDFIWEQYNSLVNSLGANAIAVIYSDKEEEANG